MHELAVTREAQLKAELESLRAQLRLREQQLFGTKSESHPTQSEAQNRPNPSKPRGQQRGQPGHPRRDHSHLPAVEEVLDLPAAPPPKLIPKSILGVSIWVEVLLDKYLFYRPTYRLLEDWKTHGLDLPLGTLTDGLQRLVPLFELVYQALVEHNQKHVHWHADETRWLVFATVEGKMGHRWTLWVFHSEQAVAFVLDQGRAHDVPEEHLGPVEEGILSVDRYSAYKAMKQVKDGRIVLAFCWAHVRRDFLGVARSWPLEEGWALGWVERIGLLYRANDARLEAQREPLAFAEKDKHLRRAVFEMARQVETELADPEIHPAREKVLLSLQDHWDGLTVFVEHPELPMDNNKAE